MGPTGDEFRVLQIHPSLRCNLRCLHCYSSSSPEEDDELSLGLLQKALTEAWDEGYNVLGVSGGEPLTFGSLAMILRHARSLGMITSVTTNGMLLNQRRIEELREVVDLIAISLDGTAESHNRMRGTPRAFEAMKRCLDNVRKANMRFGFIFTLTLHNLHELEPVARFAVEQGAALLQIHPLEEVGRAQERLVNASPDELELTYAFLEVARIQKLYENKLRVQFDVVDRQLIRNNPERVFATEVSGFEDFARSPLADLVSPLVIENDGFIVPIQYGFSRGYAIGNLKTGSLSQHAAEWKTGIYPSFLQLCRKVFHNLLDIDRSDQPFANWYGEITQASFTKVPLSYVEGALNDERIPQNLNF